MSDDELREPICASRFDYEHKMLHQMVMQEIEQKKIKESIDDLSEIMNVLKAYYLECKSTTKTIEDRLEKVEAEGIPFGSGSTYIRWGRTECPGNGTEMVYKGFAAGARHDKGGAANYVCLPEEPIWSVYEDAVQDSGTISGVEYEIYGRNMNNFFGKSVHNHDVPCCVCRTKRPSIIMLPGRNICYNGWILEYEGYLVSDYVSHHASEFVCLDNEPDFLDNGASNENGKLFYFVEGDCGSLPCPPYVKGRELTCAVCSK